MFLQIGLTIVDEGYNKPPVMIKDIYWSREIQPLYSEQSMQMERRSSGVTGSVAHIKYAYNIMFIFSGY